MFYPKCDSIRGFMLLPAGGREGYYGVERFPFQPEFESQPQLYVSAEDELKIWHYCPPGWKQDAYRLYEEHQVRECDERIHLISSLEIASKIRDIIRLYLGQYDVVRIEAWDLKLVDTIQPEPISMGYDVAYLGGNLNSAIYGYIDAYPTLIPYKPLLNQWGLFPAPAIIPGYLRQFREAVHSEASSEFHVFRLRAT